MFHAEFEKMTTRSPIPRTLAARVGAVADLRVSWVEAGWASEASGRRCLLSARLNNIRGQNRSAGVGVLGTEEVCLAPRSAKIAAYAPRQRTKPVHPN